MQYAGFIGAAYRARSLASSGDLCQNLSAEPVETGKGASPVALYGTPGLSQPLCTLDNAPVRGFTTLNGRTWAVGGEYLYEIVNNGTQANKLAQLPWSPGSTPAALQSDGRTVVIAATDVLYSWDILTATLAKIDGFKGRAIGIQDGFFIASVPNTRQFQISALNDGKSWSPSDFANKNGYPDNLTGLAVNRRQLWLMGGDTSEVWWLSGNVNFPFERLQGIFIETGLSAAASLSQLDQTLFWIGRSKRGQGLAWKANGFLPQRISTFAIEYAMSQYARIDDAVGYTYEENGHPCWVVTFPTAFQDPATGTKSPRTWVFDIASGWWHERCWLNPLTGTQEAVRGWVHTFNFGMHLVGDRETGKIYQQALGILTDAGQPIKRVRRGPVLTFENKNTFYHRLELMIQSGFGVPQEAGAGQPMVQGSLPLFNLRISRDGGYTFGNEIEVQGGAVGQYGARVFWGPLGAGRREVFEISSSEPIEHCWLEATIEASPGTS